MPYGDQLQACIVFEREIGFQILQQSFQLALLVVKTYRKTYCRMLHQVDVDFVLAERIEDSCQVVFGNERQVFRLNAE